ncbi:hypothetical protein BCEP4_880011 [Burkholderia cepacia]|nr:hypothetical protein BCEP4_880011 [Burkholderia cepacia]
MAAPSWVRADQKALTLMLFSAVDDCSGVVYQEYRCVYGEDVVVDCASRSTRWRQRRRPICRCMACRACCTWIAARSPAAKYFSA